LVGSGEGGVDELKSHLQVNKIYYGLVRVTDQIDNSVTVKFVFIIWCGEKVPFVQKGKMTTHKGSITTLIGQFHNDLNCSNQSEISSEIIMSKVRAASGTAIHVKEKEGFSHTTPSPVLTSSTGGSSASKAPSSTKSTVKPSVPQGSTSVIQFEDEDNIRQAIKQVRSDTDETDWLLLGYEGAAKIKLQAKGSDGLDGLLHHLKMDQVQYALYRTTDTVDNTVAVKFVFVIWVGESVAVIRKARITTHKGELTSFIGQYHVDLNCSNLNEINDEIIRDLVQHASGTASYVK